MLCSIFKPFCVFLARFSSVYHEYRHVFRHEGNCTSNLAIVCCFFFFYLKATFTKTRNLSRFFPRDLPPIKGKRGTLLPQKDHCNDGRMIKWEWKGQSRDLRWRKDVSAFCADEALKHSSGAVSPPPGLSLLVPLTPRCGLQTHFHHSLSCWPFVLRRW